MTYSYDNAYQLTRERRSGANAYDVTYSYDPVGNRLTKIEGGTTTTYSYDAANQLNVEVTPSARTTYTYDANGNTSVINAAGSRTTYSWDLENHITLAQLPGGGRNTMTYDGDGKRRRTEDSDGLRNIVWDEENILVETDSGGSAVARYTLAPELYGTLISQRRSGATSFHHFDALGSTRVLTNSAQTATDTRDYEAFGLTNGSSGSTANRFWWVGRLGYYSQKDTQDYWVRDRVALPGPGRWESSDPLRSGMNWFLYGLNDPAGSADPSGRRRFISWGQRRVNWCKVGWLSGPCPDDPGCPEPGIVFCDPSDPRERQCMQDRIRQIDDMLRGMRRRRRTPQEESGFVTWACTECECERRCEQGERVYYLVYRVYGYGGPEFPTCGCVQKCVWAHEKQHGQQCLDWNVPMITPGGPWQEEEGYRKERECLKNLLKQG